MGANDGETLRCIQFDERELPGRTISTSRCWWKELV
jgi:hypothetical protein